MVMESLHQVIVRTVLFAHIHAILNLHHHHQGTHHLELLHRLLLQAIAHQHLLGAANILSPLLPHLTLMCLTTTTRLHRLCLCLQNPQSLSYLLLSFCLVLFPFTWFEGTCQIILSCISFDVEMVESYSNVSAIVYVML